MARRYVRPRPVKKVSSRSRAAVRPPFWRSGHRSTARPKSAAAGTGPASSPSKGASAWGVAAACSAINLSQRWAQPSRTWRRRTTPVCRSSCHGIPCPLHQAATRLSRRKVQALPVSSWDQSADMPRLRWILSRTSTASPVRITSGWPSAAKSSLKPSKHSATKSHCRADMSTACHSSGSATNNGRTPVPVGA